MIAPQTIRATQADKDGLPLRLQRLYYFQKTRYEVTLLNTKSLRNESLRVVDLPRSSQSSSLISSKNIFETTLTFTSKTLRPTYNPRGQLCIRYLGCATGSSGAVSPIKNQLSCQAKLMSNNNESGWKNMRS